MNKNYRKKEEKKGIKLIATKVTNNSNRDMTFGRDTHLVYEDGSEVIILDKEQTYKYMKQISALHLFYLLFMPMNLYVTNGNSETTDSYPIGLVIGPGLTVFNLAVASSANRKFKSELETYEILGTII